MFDLVDELDLSAILIPAQSNDPCGEKSFSPRLSTQSCAQRFKLLLYA